MLQQEQDRGQVSGDAAEVYEEFFVPALFREWAARVAGAAGIQPGWRVLDVACGTGVLARTVAEQVGVQGSVVGLDLNEGMLRVAKRIAPHIEWRQGRAESLPFDTHSFDATVSQFGLMFFEDRRAALQEMIRVLRPGGHLAVAVWDSLDNTPGYAAVTALLQRLLGDPVADLLRAPFVLGDPQLLQSLFTQAGIPNATVTPHAGTARFPSIRSWMYTDVKGWTLAGKIDDEQFEQLCEEAEQVLRPYAADGTVAFSAPAYIVTASKA
ncbi:MAG: methyltransferase domain-containing protein [Caldilineaceae bacterium]|nr:methyltransferase domain-containing protein [Caldilineaceae bacterium]